MSDQLKNKKARSGIARTGIQRELCHSRSSTKPFAGGGAAARWAASAAQALY